MNLSRDLCVGACGEGSLFSMHVRTCLMIVHNLIIRRVSVGHFKDTYWLKVKQPSTLKSPRQNGNTVTAVISFHMRLRILQNRWKFGPDPASIWKLIWIQPFRAQKDNPFLCQIMYRISATNVWRHSGIPGMVLEPVFDATPRLTRMHRLWSSNKSVFIRKWASWMMKHSTLNPDHCLTITTAYLSPLHSQPNRIMAVSQGCLLLADLESWKSMDIWAYQSQSQIDTGYILGIICKIWARIQMLYTNYLVKTQQDINRTRLRREGHTADPTA